MASHDGQPPYITTQPSAQAASQVDPFKQYHNEWSIGLCSCCDDMGQCCYACCCWCCFIGSLSSKISEPPLLCCCVSNLLAVYRMKVRSVLKIKGSACNDCCTVCWCPLCAGVQMRSELRNRGLDW